MKVLVVFHPTPFCNLDCSYCWAPDRDVHTKMPHGIIQTTIAQLNVGSRLSRLDVCWLTGEPLVLGLPYYEEALRVCSRVRERTPEDRFVVQTNGTLIDDRWAAFFATNDFTVGVSIDGPQYVHDAQRKNKRGEGTFDAAVRGIECLIRHGVKGGALCVITRKTIESSPDELFAFFQERKISWSYLIEAQIGENSHSSHALSREDIPALRAFLSRLMELWGSEPSVYLRDFDQLARRLFGGGTLLDASDFDNQGCLDILNVTADGEYFWGNPELMSATKAGLSHIRANLNETDVWAMRKSPGYRELQKATYRGIKLCADECAFYEGCRGGNPAHKYYTTGRFDVSSHLTCELNDQVIADLMLKRVETDLAV